jgi:peptidyl-prolyl cis-trans isomerase B (cyclophilin B)
LGLLAGNLPPSSKIKGVGLIALSEICMFRQPHRWFLSCLAIALLVLTACNSSPVNSSPSSPVADTSSVPGAQSPTLTTELPRLEGNATVVLQVDGQPITIAVDGKAAPMTAGNFVDLVQKGVYDGTSFHRVVRDPQPFVVQGGDPQSKDPKVPIESLGTGSYSDPGTGQPRYVPLEIKPEGTGEIVYSKTLKSAKVSAPPQLKHSLGAVAMARSPLPDSASAQFYITLAPVAFLDGDYAVFGYVTQGMEVVEKIKQGDRIQSAKVTQGAENLKTGPVPAPPSP